VELDEGVGVEPVPPDGVPPVDQGHADVGMVDQGVGERHAGGSGSHHQVVGLHDGAHAVTQAR
jgi:hypothetical protein